MTNQLLSPPPFGIVTAEQRTSALKGANRIRFDRIVLREEIRNAGRAGAKLLAEAIADRSPLFGRLYAWQAVQWVPGVGDVTVAILLRSAGIDPWRRMRRLRDGERALLVDALVAFAEGRRPVPPPRGRRCARCGEHMRRASLDGICGFCIAESGAVDGSALEGER